jgi:hypothetical protein
MKLLINEKQAENLNLPADGKKKYSDVRFIG